MSSMNERTEINVIYVSNEGDAKPWPNAVCRDCVGFLQRPVSLGNVLSALSLRPVASMSCLLHAAPVACIEIGQHAI